MEMLHYRCDREIPVIADTDVLVVGGGPGGFSAGVMAARNGAKTIVAERYGCLGGMPVFGEVTPLMANTVKGAAIHGPVYLEWCRKMWEYRPPEDQKQHPFDEREVMHRISKDEAMLAMEDLLLEAGAKLLYHHTLFDVIVSDGRIVAAVFHSKSGLVAVKAKIFIDSTGDGDLAVLAGCPAQFGNEEGFCQPMTTCFKLGDVDRSRMPGHPEINRLYDEAKARGEIDCLREDVLWFPSTQDDVIHFNTTRIIKKSGVVGTDLSEAEIEGRRQIRQFVKFLRKNVPGFEQARIHSIAHHVGVRESRRIVGRVFQTADDFLKAAKYPDGIAKVRYEIDIHNPSGTGTRIVHMPEGEWYEIRYGTLVPENCDNLLMGCRAISLDHALHSSARVVPPICSIGQAAGMAAAMCVEQEATPPELHGEEVRKRLAAAGAAL